MPVPDSISTTRLLRLIGTEPCPRIAHVREAEDFDVDPRLLPGSIRGSHADLSRLSRCLQRPRRIIACRLARVVRDADMDRHDLHPAAAGLLAISVGLSRLYRDDPRQREAARDGQDAGHGWSATGGAA